MRQRRPSWRLAAAPGLDAQAVLWPGLHEARLVRGDDGLDAITKVELHQDPCHVRLHRRVADEQLLRDLRVRQAAREQLEDLELARGQVVERRRGALLGDGAAEIGRASCRERVLACV